MIKYKLLRYAPVLGFISLAAAFMIIKNMSFITSFVYAMLVVGGVSIGSCAVDIISDVISYFRFRSKKMVTMTVGSRTDRITKGENSNEV